MYIQLMLSRFSAIFMLVLTYFGIRLCGKDVDKDNRCVASTLADGVFVGIVVVVERLFLLSNLLLLLLLTLGCVDGNA